MLNHYLWELYVHSGGKVYLIGFGAMLFTMTITLYRIMQLIFLI